MVQTLILFIALFITVDSVAIDDNPNESHSKNDPPLLTDDHLDNFESTGDHYDPFLSDLHDKGESSNQPYNLYKRKLTDNYFYNDDQKADQNDKILKLKLRRASPGLMKLLKSFFITTATEKSTTTTEAKQERTKENTPRTNNTQISIPRQIVQNRNIEKSEAARLNDHLFTSITRQIVQNRNTEKAETARLNDHLLISKLDEILQRMIERLVELFKTKDEQGYIYVKIPFSPKDLINHRWKREIKDEEPKNVTEKVTVNTIMNVTKIPEIAENKFTTVYLTLKPTFAKNLNNFSKLQNTTEHRRSNVNNHNDTITIPVKTIEKSGKNYTNLRKSNDNTNVILKIDLAYQDIIKQIKPLEKIKASFSHEKAFKAGFIIGNLQTLELTLKKLIEKNNSKHNWSEMTAHRVLEKLKLSKMIVSNLMNYLKMMNTASYST